MGFIIQCYSAICVVLMHRMVWNKNLNKCHCSCLYLSYLIYICNICGLRNVMKIEGCFKALLDILKYLNDHEIKLNLLNMSMF